MLISLCRVNLPSSISPFVWRTSFNMSCSTGLLAVNSPSVFLSGKKSSFHLQFGKVFLLNMDFCLYRLLFSPFQSFKNVTLLFSGLIVSDEKFAVFFIFVSLCVMSLFLWLPSIFSLYLWCSVILLWCI